MKVLLCNKKNMHCTFYSLVYYNGSELIFVTFGLFGMKNMYTLYVTLGKVNVEC